MIRFEGKPLPIWLLPIDVDLDGKIPMRNHVILFGLADQSCKMRLLVPKFTDPAHPAAMEFKSALYEGMDLFAQAKYGGEWIVATIEEAGRMALEDVGPLYGPGVAILPLIEKTC